MFILSPDKSQLYSGYYDGGMVILSIVISIVACITAFNIASRINEAITKTGRSFWLMLSAFTMATGVWAMHFIGMLAFRLPCGVSYDVIITLLSFVPAFAASASAINLIAKKNITQPQLAMASLTLGGGIGLMHYSGMAAMNFQGIIYYNFGLFALSIVVAVLLSYAALFLSIKFKKSKKVFLILAGITMGCSIALMHFIAMTATYFMKDLGSIVPIIGIHPEQMQRIVIVALLITSSSLGLSYFSHNRLLKRELKTSDNIFHALIDNVKDYAILMLDKDGFILTWNIGTERIKGYKSSEIIGKHFTVFYTVEDIASAKPAKILQLALKDGRYEEEGVRVKVDGSLFFASVIITPIYSETGVHQGFSKITRDITEKKLADKRLELAATIYQALGEAVLVIDNMNLIIAVNPAMSKLVNMSEAQLLNQPIDIIQAKNQRSDFYLTIFEQLDQVGHWQGESWLHSSEAEGYDFNQWGVINNIYDDDGQLVRRIAMFSKITNQKIAEQTIWFQANFDPLTNLPNRNMLQYRLEQAISKSKRDHTKVAVIAIDLDRFKEVNDSLGHDHGDLLLVEVASRLLSSIRHTDCVSRFGGDEFVVVLTEIKEIRDVELIAKKILDQLRAIYHLNDEAVYISGSIGITISPEDGLDATLLLKNADQAMYEAKKLGKNRFCYFTTALQEAVTLRLKLINDMKVAIVDHQFKVAYQPIIDFKTNTISKAEALVRWHHPMLGIVNPATFIPIAEESGFIRKLDDWVLAQAITQCDAWRKTYHPDFKISVNKSPLEFTDADYEEPLEGGLMLRIMGDLVVIEITEGVLLKNEDGIHSKLNTLRVLGVELALDDFGTGYSSLSYLNKFKIDYIKIDQSFVRNLTLGSNDLALCEAIIAMAHKLGIKVIAEGIESEVHYELLKNADCDYGQGYYISRPVYSDDFELLMMQQTGR